MIEGLQQEIRFLNALLKHEPDMDTRECYKDLIYRYEAMLEACTRIH